MKRGLAGTDNHGEGGGGGGGLSSDFRAREKKWGINGRKIGSAAPWIR